MDVARGLHEKLHQRGVRALTGDQHGGGGDQLYVVRWHVMGEVGNAPRQGDGAEVAEAARIGLGLREFEQADARGAQQHLHRQEEGSEQDASESGSGSGSGSESDESEV